MNYESCQRHVLADDDPACRRCSGSHPGIVGRYQSSWSAFARSAPFFEQSAFYNSINLDFTYSDGTNTTATFTPLAFLYCPSDPGDHIDDTSLGGTGDATTSYGTCDGDWYVWSVNWGTTNTVGPMNRSLFGPNYSRRIAMVTDGTSNTLMAAEGPDRPRRRCGAAGAHRRSHRTRSPGPGRSTNVPLPGPNSAAALAIS